MSNGTPLFPGWYIKFQTAVLEQLPRPGEIDQNTASGWKSNQSGLKATLAEALLPPQSEDSAQPYESVLKLFGGLKLVACQSMFFQLSQDRADRHSQFLNRSARAVVAPGYFDDEERFLHGLAQNRLYRVHVFAPASERTTMFREKMRQARTLDVALHVGPLDAACVWYECLSEIADRLPSNLRFYDFRSDDVLDHTWKKGAPCIRNVDRSPLGRCRFYRAANKLNESLSLPKNTGLVVITRA